MALLRKVILVPVLLVRPIAGRLVRAARRLRRPGAEDAKPIAERARYAGAYARSLSAPLWRRSIRFSWVLVGFALYLGMQFAMAYLIDQLWWWFIVAFFIIAGSLALAAAKPEIAFITWLFSAPFAFVIIKMDFGEGLPAVSFDRVTMLFLSLLLVSKTLVNRVPMRRLLLGEALSLLFVIYTAFSVLFVQSQNVLGLLSEKFDYLALSLIIYFAAKASLTKKEHLVWAMVAMVGAGIYSAGFGFYEHFTGNQWFSSFVGADIGLAFPDVEKGRIAGPFLNPTAFGTYMGIATFLAFHLSGWTTRKSARLFYYASMVLMFIACYWCFTRGGYLAMITLLLATPFLMRGRQKQYALLTTAIIVMGIMVLPTLLARPDVYTRMTRKETIYTRIIVTATTLNIIRHNFWFGVGLGKIDEALEQNVVSAGNLSGMHIRSYFPGKRGLIKTTTSHNSLLTTAAEQGFVGALLYISGILALMVQLLRVRARLPDNGDLGKDFVTLVLIAVVGYALSISTYDVRFFRFPTYAIWILFALVIRLGELLEQEEAAGQPETSPALSGVPAAVSTAG